MLFRILYEMSLIDSDVERRIAVLRRADERVRADKTLRATTLIANELLTQHQQLQISRVGRRNRNVCFGCD